MECLDPDPACSRWQANQLPAHRLPLAAAQLEARGTEVLAPAAATFETIRRTFVKIAVRVAELKVVIKLPSGRHACGDDGRDHDEGPMIDAARVAPSPHFNHKTRSDCHGGALVPPAVQDLRRWLTDAEAGLVSDWRLAEAPASTVAPQIILDTTDGLSASYRTCRTGYKSSIRAITSFLPCRHGYGRIDRRPFSLLPRRRLPS
jgi:hypothetical protein